MVVQNGVEHPKLNALRTDEDHHLHHALGDVGGQYRDQKDVDGIKIGPEHFEAAERARQGAVEPSKQDEERPAEPVLIVVMVCVDLGSIVGLRSKVMLFMLGCLWLWQIYAWRSSCTYLRTPVRRR